MHEGAAVWLHLCIVKESAAAALTEQYSLKSKFSHYRVKEGVLKTYFAVVNHLLETYSPNDIIVETDRKIARYTKPSTMSLLEFWSELQLKTLKWLHVCGECFLKVISIKGLMQSIRHSRWAHCRTQKTAPMQKLAYYPTFSTKRQAAVGPRKEPAVYMSSWHRSKNIQRNRRKEKFNSFGSSGNIPSRRWYSRKGVEGAAINEAGVLSLTNCTTTAVNMG